MKIKDLVNLLKQYPQEAYIGVDTGDRYEEIEIEVNPYDDRAEIDDLDTPGEYDPTKVFFILQGGCISMFNDIK